MAGVAGGGGRWRVGCVCGEGGGHLPGSLKVACDANKQTKPMTKTDLVSVSTVSTAVEMGVSACCPHLFTASVLGTNGSKGTPRSAHIRQTTQPHPSGERSAILT